MKTKNKKKLKEFKNKSLKERGITLIALVITIIVLIILAGVTINLILSQNGIINKAKQAKEDYKQAETNEQVALNEVTQLIEETTGNGGSGTPEITEITEKTVSDLKAGNYIKYDTGVTSVGENGVITCRVLYDSKSEYGVQIISDKSIADVTLGGSDWTTASASYNNAITTLNTEAEKYLNTKYATDARCVGSVPTTSRNRINDKFINKNSDNAGPVTLQFTSSVEGVNNMKDTDTNYETDETQLERLRIWGIREDYWIASRYVDSDSFTCVFIVRFVAADVGLYSSYMCGVNSGGGAGGDSYTFGFRPCFSLKFDIKITGGNGTSESPYTM